MRRLFATIIASATLLGSATGFEEQIRPFLDRYCIDCHGGEKVKGKVDYSKIQTATDVDAQFELWETVIDVLKHQEMPPEEEKLQPTESEAKAAQDWLRHRISTPAEARPGEFKPRRLSGPEYRNTLRSLFGFDLEVSIVAAEQTVIEKSLVLKLLPTDPPGASGFINDTHGASLSTVIWDQYSFLADTAIEKLFTLRHREKLEEFVGSSLPPKVQISQEQARQLIHRFTSRAFRRPVEEEQAIPSINGKTGSDLIEAVKTELKTVLMSPAFMYRGLLMKGTPDKQQKVDDFEFAERLSYFLWEDMPDEELSNAARNSKLSEKESITEQIERMLASPKARSLSTSFAVQWLTLDEIDHISNDPTQVHAFKNQPIDFFNYLISENRPVIELIDSKTAFANNLTAGFYGDDRKQIKKVAKPSGIERQALPNQRITLHETNERGGILTMPGVLIMNKGPILRGTWMLRRILGEQLSDPPADVPAIKPSPRGKNLSFRERFELHRSNATCARCHNKIDPLGFAMQAYNDRGVYTHITPHN